MYQKQVVQVRIDNETKAQAAAVLADVGLTVSDVVRILITRIAREKAVPLELRVPNAALDAPAATVADEEARNHSANTGKPK